MIRVDGTVFRLRFRGGREKWQRGGSPRLRDVSEQDVDLFLSQVGGCSREKSEVFE